MATEVKTMTGAQLKLILQTDSDVPHNMTTGGWGSLKGKPNEQADVMAFVLARYGALPDKMLHSDYYRWLVIPNIRPYLVPVVKIHERVLLAQIETFTANFLGSTGKDLVREAYKNKGSRLKLLSHLVEAYNMVRGDDGGASDGMDYDKDYSEFVLLDGLTAGGVAKVRVSTKEIPNPISSPGSGPDFGSVGSAAPSSAAGDSFSVGFSEKK